MTDVSPGPGWWLASDGQWYPPHLHPDVRARADAVVDDAPHVDTPNVDAPHVDTPHIDEPTAAPHNGATAAPIATQYVPEREPIDWARVAEERAARRKAADSGGRLKYIGAGLVTLGALGAFWMFARNDNDGDLTQPTSDTDTPTSTTVAPATTTTAAVVTTTTIPGTVSVFSLLPGTCVQNADLLSGRVTTVVEVTCDQPHTHEVYHKVTYTPPDGVYDEARISAFASEQCTQSFAAYVGVPFDRSKYYYVQFSPTQESWTQQGDREVMCLLFLQGSELTGSAKGTAQ